MYMNSFITRITALLLVTLITGCGFQLRGTENKPDYLDNIYVAGQGEYSNFMRALKNRLITQGIAVTENTQLADLTLTITNSNRERRAFTITRSDRVDEYQLISTVTFKVTTPGGSEVLPERSIVVERIYLYNRDQVIGTEYEQDMYEKEMDQEVINQIITRLYAITEEDIANAKAPTTKPVEQKEKIKLNDILDKQY